MAEHALKTWPAPFAAVLSGEKRHEIRKADRPFAVGDVLELQEWESKPSNNRCRACGKTMRRYEDYNEWQHADCGGLVEPIPGAGYTGRSLRVRVTYLSAGGTWGLPEGLCVMSVDPLATTTPHREGKEGE